MKEIANRSPINKTAALVTSKSSDNYRHCANNIGDRSDLPIPTKEATKEQRFSPDFIDFTSMVIGRLVVVGLLKSNKKRPIARWVVKCCCGMYEMRKATVLAKGDLGKSMCQECNRLNENKDRSARRSGK